MIEQILDEIIEKETEITRPLVIAGLNMAKEIILSHSNDENWVPISDRVPDVQDDTWYWCTCWAPHTGYFTQPAKWWPEIGDFIKPCHKGCVVAWMEIYPAPYIPKE